VQVLVLAFVDYVCSVGFDDKGAVDHFQHLQLPGFVLFVLLHFLQSYSLARSLEPGAINFAKSAATNQFLDYDVFGPQIFRTIGRHLWLWLDILFDHVFERVGLKGLIEIFEAVVVGSG